MARAVYHRGRERDPAARRAAASPAAGRLSCGAGPPPLRSSATSTRRARRSAPLAAALLAATACGAPPPAHDVAGRASDGLVFARAEGAGSDLYRLRIADGAVRPWLRTPDRAETWPIWAEAPEQPGGGWLVFQAEPAPHGAADLWIQTPGGPPRPLAAHPDRDERWAVWSPDGRAIAYAWRGAAGGGISLVPAAGGPERVLARSGARDFFFRPGFAPDGRRLVAQRRGPDGRGSTLWLLAAGPDPAPPRRLTRGAGEVEQKPFFTRTGELVFARQRPPGPRALARVDAAGRVASLAAGRDGADEHSARPSPTRDEIAFVSDRAGSRDVWLADLRGTEARNLTRTPDRDEFAPRWSPDGERLVVTAVPPRPPGPGGERLDPRETRLVVLDRSGRLLAETAGMMADWMPPFERAE